MVTFDADDASARLDTITEQTEECRAALLVAGDGDPSAIEGMRGAIDRMAEELAVLRAAVGGAELG